ncbi:MAG: hypothetical protein IJ638_04195 [Alphaproteobacteria bacterium]|nr:hypothetical protein [Alphaproteobacteria bacterium]
MKNIQIKPCPCCGNVPSINQSSNERFISCDKVMFNTHTGMRVVFGNTDIEVIARWNKFIEDFASNKLGR